MPKWNNTNKIAVLVSVQTDQRANGMAANVGVQCPVCETPKLDYDQFDPLNLIAWCRGCETGLTKGRWAAEIAKGKKT